MAISHGDGAGAGGGASDRHIGGQGRGGGQADGDNNRKSKSLHSPPLFPARPWATLFARPNPGQPHPSWRAGATRTEVSFFITLSACAKINMSKCCLFMRLERIYLGCAVGDTLLSLLPRAVEFCCSRTEKNARLCLCFHQQSLTPDLQGNLPARRSAAGSPTRLLRRSHRPSRREPHRLPPSASPHPSATAR